MRALLIALALLCLAGCGRGPDEDALQKDVAAQLAQAAPADTLALVDFARRGSQSDSKAPAGETRRILYFDVELKLERDYDFGAWDSPNVAGIVSALGVAPKGITGINSGGNKAGDIVRAHGTALYKHENGKWEPVISGGYAPAKAPAYAEAAPAGSTAEFLASMRRISEAIPGNVPTPTRRVIEQELASTHASIQAALTRADAGYVLAGGPEHGQYYRFARALPHGDTARLTALVTRGGEDNLRMLRDGRAQLAIAQADAALDAYEGKGNFVDMGPYTTLRAVGSLYPEPVHILVRSDGPFATVSDLTGHRVVVGPLGSASRTTALRVLEAHGLELDDVELLDLPLGEALIDLRAKKVDAVIQVIGMPADSVRDALAAVPLRLMPLSDLAINKLTASGKGYVAYTIPRGAYATQKQKVPTIATAALLLVSPNLSGVEVSAIARYVFGAKHDFAARGSAQGTQVSANNARRGLSVPLHLSSAKVLEELAPSKR